ncbi:hypothetical protein BV898_08467 [Hypsibius exemplaris]|uniref:Uncharacterized protein n=1 Tax=Hypsibius exemplaris TaxID=2072580 RepID=A0A1W0WQ92_HYPEX|nr:hypothetical protein BV898_08467 [Hypsibius exemplaris]
MRGQGQNPRGVKDTAVSIENTSKAISTTMDMSTSQTCLPVTETVEKDVRPKKDKTLLSMSRSGHKARNCRRKPKSNRNRSTGGGVGSSATGMFQYKTTTKSTDVDLKIEWISGEVACGGHWVMSYQPVSSEVIKAVGVRTSGRTRFQQSFQLRSATGHQRDE